MRAVVPAAAIEIISQHTKYSAHQIFDVIGGQSFGGLLALACVASTDGGRTAALKSSDLAQSLIDMAPHIFQKRQQQ